MRPVKRKKLENSLIVIYSSATKITLNTRTRKEHLFAEEIIVIHNTDNCMNTSANLSVDIICSKMRSFQRTKLEENCELRGTNNVQG